MTIAALVLVGSTNRFGTPKHLIPIDGRPLVRHVVEAAVSSSCDAVAVVVGAHAARVESALEGLDVVCLPNARWIEGMASSIRAGVAWADARGFDDVVVLVADQLRVTNDHVDALVRTHRRGHAMTASRYCNVLGVPAVFARSRFPALMSLVGDRGARDVLVDVPDVATVDWREAAVTPLRVPSRAAPRARRETPRSRARSR